MPKEINSNLQTEEPWPLPSHDPSLGSVESRCLSSHLLFLRRSAPRQRPRLAADRAPTLPATRRETASRAPAARPPLRGSRSACGPARSGDRARRSRDSDRLPRGGRCPRHRNRRRASPAQSQNLADEDKNGSHLLGRRNRNYGKDEEERRRRMSRMLWSSWRRMSSRTTCVSTRTPGGQLRRRGGS